MTLAEISRKGKMPLNGNLSAKVQQLIQSGFVRAHPFFGQKKKDVRC